MTPQALPDANAFVRGDPSAADIAGVAPKFLKKGILKVSVVCTSLHVPIIRPDVPGLQGI
jgi:hypothetical protein